MKRSLVSSANASRNSRPRVHPLGRVNTNSFEQGRDGEAVELGAVLDNLDRGLQVVEEAVDIGKKNSDVRAGAEEVGELEGGDEVCRWRGQRG